MIAMKDLNRRLCFLFVYYESIKRELKIRGIDIIYKYLYVFGRVGVFFFLDSCLPQKTTGQRDR
jgi:hypothetical protein